MFPKPSSSSFSSSSTLVPTCYSWAAISTKKWFVLRNTVFAFTISLLAKHLNAPNDGLELKGNVKDMREHLFIFTCHPAEVNTATNVGVFVHEHFMSAKWYNCCKGWTQCQSQNNTSDLNHCAYLNNWQWQWLAFFLMFIKYIRVMPLGGQCYEEGPFFPTTPRYAVQVGIARKQDLLLKPDWTAIIGVITGLLTLLVTCVVLTVSNSYTKSLLKRYYKILCNEPTSHLFPQASPIKLKILAQPYVLYMR